MTFSCPSWLLQSLHGVLASDACQSEGDFHHASLVNYDHLPPNCNHVRSNRASRSNHVRPDQVLPELNTLEERLPQMYLHRGFVAHNEKATHSLVVLLVHVLATVDEEAASSDPRRIYRSYDSKPGRFSPGEYTTSLNSTSAKRAYSRSSSVTRLTSWVCTRSVMVSAWTTMVALCCTSRS